MISAAVRLHRSMSRIFNVSVRPKARAPVSCLARTEGLLHLGGRRSTNAGSVLTRHCPHMGGGDNLAGEVFGVEDGSGSQKE
jgi:hypothetical protein